MCLHLWGTNNVWREPLAAFHFRCIRNRRTNSFLFLSIAKNQTCLKEGARAKRTNEWNGMRRNDQNVQKRQTVGKSSCRSNGMIKALILTRKLKSCTKTLQMHLNGFVSKSTVVRLRRHNKTLPYMFVVCYLSCWYISHFLTPYTIINYETDATESETPFPVEFRWNFTC